MLLTPHVLVGLAIAKLIPNPVIAVPAAFLSHFLGDMVPHWDFYSKTEKNQRIKGWRPIAVMADFAAGIFIGTFFTLNALWVKQDSVGALAVFLCGIFSVLPDAIEVPHIYMEKSPRITELMLKVQRKFQIQAPIRLGVINQILISLICLFILKAY